MLFVVLMLSHYCQKLAASKSNIPSIPYIDVENDINEMAQCLHWLYIIDGGPRFF